MVKNFGSEKNGSEKFGGEKLGSQIHHTASSSFRNVGDFDGPVLSGIYVIEPNPKKNNICKR